MKIYSVDVMFDHGGQMRRFDVYADCRERAITSIMEKVAENPERMDGNNHKRNITEIRISPTLAKVL